MDQTERHPKGWGEELWIANSPLYCGKKLILKKDKKCSVHYHKLKDETFYVQSGVVQLDIYPDGYPGKIKRNILEAGDSLHIPPGLPHQFYGLEDSEIFEFSTEHREEDSYRLAPGDSQLQR
jgi:mannose-6-phosphate isomerase-like protein (cupin superfamily)